ncbi:MAG: class I adenylate-forming enzyme family protein [Verrucomicrobiota bacterium]
MLAHSSPHQTRLQAGIRSCLLDQPARVVLRDGEHSITGGELIEKADRLAGGLDLAIGDRVAFLAPNTIEAVAVVLACYLHGLIAVPLNYRFTAAEAGHVIQKVRPSVLIGDGDRQEVLEEIVAEFPDLDTVGIGWDADLSFEELLLAEPADPEGVSEDALALILMTSGSTGEPKGVVHTHQTVWEGAHSAKEAYGYSEKDVLLVSKPISHAGGLQTQLFGGIFGKAHIVLSMRPKPSDAVTLIQKHKVTVSALLASDFLDFIEYLEDTGTHLPTVNRFVASGDAVPHDLHERFAKIFGFDPTEGCGISEVAAYFTMNPMDGTNRRGSIGIPTPRFKVRIVDDEGKDVPQGETGEIVVQSKAVTPGYWEDPERTQELFRDGWMLTGDLGHKDEDGFFWFKCRKKLLIVRRGSNISPIEVEDHLDEHPKVHASVVVGVKDRRDGEVPVAFIAPLDPEDIPTTEELTRFAAEQLASYKIPVRFLFRSELPRTATGKFDRNELHEEAVVAYVDAVSSDKNNRD